MITGNMALGDTRLRPEVRDRQTDVRRASSLNAPTLGAGV